MTSNEDPRRGRRTWPPAGHPAHPAATYDRTAYRGRNVIERALNGFKRWRGKATRYDKHAIVHRGGPVLAAVLLWLTDFGDTS